MATNDSLQRYIDAGIAFTHMTRKKAEELVSELVKNGDLQTDEAKARVDELLERGRQGTEVIVSTVRSEVSASSAAVGHHQPRGPGHPGRRAAGPVRVDQGAGHQGPGQEGPGQEDGRQEGTGQEGPGQEDGRQEGPGEEDGRREGPGQEGSGGGRTRGARDHRRRFLAHFCHRMGNLSTCSPCHQYC